MLRFVRKPSSSWRRALHALRDSSLLPSAVDASSASIALTNPASGEVITRVSETAENDVASLIPTAEAQSRWRATAIDRRIWVLERLHTLVQQHKNDLAYLLHIETGKPEAEAHAEVDYANAILRWFTQPALHALQTSFTRHSQSVVTHSTYEPVGTVLAVTPFNLPLALLMRKVAPAVAAGCTVAFKPSEKATLPAIALHSLIERAGVPPGTVVPLLGGGDVVRAALEHVRVRLLSFTGSSSVGHALARQAAGKRVSLELGGNAPFIVFADADIKQAIRDVLRNRLRCAGQTCIAANRIFVHASVHDEFVEGLTKRVRSGPKVGPLIEAAAADRAHARVKQGVRQGAVVECGTEVTGTWFSAGVVTGVTDEMELVAKETFAPVFSVLAFVNEDEVVQRGNARGGLAAYVYTRELARGLRMVDRLECGMVGLNSVALSTGHTEFGGIGDAGVGREGGLVGLQLYLERKYCVIAGA